MDLRNTLVALANPAPAPAIAGVGLLVIAAGVPGAAMAGDPYCAIEETCTVTSDNCVPADGRLVFEALQGGKARVVLDDEVMGEAAILSMSSMTTLMFTTEAGVQNQVRIQQSGAFTYLVSKPDAAAFNGKDQVLYRGQCVEG